MDGIASASDGTAHACGQRQSLREQVDARLRELGEDVKPSMASGRGSGERGSLSAAVIRRLGMAGGFGRAARRSGSQPGRAASSSGRGGAGGPALFVGARQRVLVKAFIGRHMGPGAARNPGKAITQHLRYLAREGRGMDGAEAEFFGPDGQVARDTVHEACAGWDDDRHHFRLIISPEHGDRMEDLNGYVRSVMKDLSAELREPKLDWFAVSHFDTGHPHTHVLIRGRRANGKDLVIPRKVLTQGIRQRAEYRAQELLGDQSRGEAERGLFARTTADRWTDIDAKMAAIAEANAGRFPASELARRDVFGSVMRARLQHLEKLGLVADRDASGVQIVPDARARLERLQTAKDQIRSHWEARRQEAFQSLARPQEKEAQAELSTRPKARQRPSQSVERQKPSPAPKPQPELQQPELQQAEPRAPMFDVTVDRMTPLDAELMRRGQLTAGTPLDARYRADVEALLEARARHLIERGDGIRQGHGVGYRPEAWARLRDREVAEAIRDQLGLKLDGRLSYGRTEGVVAGTISTSLGRHVVIDRGVGFAVAPLPAGHELAVGQVIGRSLGIER